MNQNLEKMKNTKKILYSLYAAGAVLGASMLSGCVTKTVYVYPDGRPAYTPTPTSSYNNSDAGAVMGGILQGIGMGLSGL